MGTEGEVEGLSFGKLAVGVVCKKNIRLLEGNRKAARIYIWPIRLLRCPYIISNTFTLNTSHVERYVIHRDCKRKDFSQN